MGWRDVIFKTINVIQKVQNIQKPSSIEAFVPSVPFVGEDEKLKTVSGRETEKIPPWCSRSCKALIEMHTPQGKLSGCRQELDGHIAWITLYHLKGCPMKIGRAAINDEGWPEWF